MNSPIPNKKQTFFYQKRAFTLVITISLLVLLVLIAVGLLSLSSVSLRTTSRSEAQSVARAHARMALLMALGDLQKSAGPDRAITATSEILARPATVVAKPRMTGVWKSWWNFTPNSSPNYVAEKTNRFDRWLVSHADASATQSRDFVTTAWAGKNIELVGAGSLGANAATDARVVAGLVPVSRDNQVQGAYAWHVSDESVKARINLYRDPSQNTTLAQRRALLAGHRPDTSLIKAPDGSLLTSLPTDLSVAEFAKAEDVRGKIIDLEQAELLDQAKLEIKPLRNDITPYSLGVMADARNGGLKQDLSSVFEMGSASTNTLPTDFTNKRLYASTHGITAISDPLWSAVAGYYNSFRSLTRAEVSPTLALRAGSANLNPLPTGFSPAPVIAKVDTIFSIVARPLVNQAGWISGNNNLTRVCFDYHLNLIITPVVTLHNPYNVNVSFQRMEVNFRNIPVAFNFMFQNNGTGPFVSQNVSAGNFEAFNTMLYNHSGFRNDRAFSITIADWTDENPLPGSTGVNGPIILKPGQTLVCGPVMPPNSSYDQDTKSGSSAVGFDWENDLISNIKAKPAFTPGMGFETNSLSISNFRAAKFNQNDRIVPGQPYFPGGWQGHGFFFLRDASAAPKIASSTATDRFYVEYKVQRPGWYVNDNSLDLRYTAASFAVTARIQPTSADTLTDFARLQFDYGDSNYLDTTAIANPPALSSANDNLRKVFGDRVFRYPPSGTMTASQVAAPSGVPYGSQASFLHPIGIFSAYSRTTRGGVYETGKRTRSGVDSPQVNLLKDGRLAGTPFLFHNPSRTNFTVDLSSQKPGVQAYELNFQPFLSKGDFQDYMDVDTNRVPALSGNMTTTGIKSGSYLEVPSGPLMTIADLRRSNALSSSYLPHFVQPVSNSRLHPLMSPDKVIETNSLISTTPMLDHSFLANHALYDRFYFSTFATRGVTRPNAVFEQFMRGTAPLALQAFQPYLPSGKTIAIAQSELYNGSSPSNTAYRNASEYQMLRGPFNVNSTSVQAWKAMLGSMKNSDISTLWARSAALERRSSTGIPIFSMSMPNGTATKSNPIASNKIDNERTNDWNGYRELTDAELELLAQKIVDEVRERGPFLSLSEFVNRQIGPASPLTLSGALESAIAKAEINEKQNAQFPDTFLNQVPITAADLSDTKLYAYRTIDATIGNPAAGAPGWVNQGDVMRLLEPAATVRGDTFVIRSYGEAQDANGNITAKAFAEAVVQRVPDYLDPSDRPSVNAVTDASAKPTNKAFGRRINVVSFRWLTPNEI